MVGFTPRVAICAVLLLGCSSVDYLETVNGSDPEIVNVSQTITVRQGQIFDGKGKLYDWTGQGDCSQSEGMPPMFKLASNSALRNLRMRNAPDGVHIKGSNVLVDNIVNLDVCEDAISIKLDENKSIPKDIIISNSKFYDCEDKAIQITRGKNLLIANNEFHRCAKTIRVKENASDIRFENNKVYDAKIAIKVTGGSGSATGNFIDGAKVAIWAEQNGVFEDKGGNRLRRVDEPIRETEGGSVIVE